MLFIAGIPVEVEDREEEAKADLEKQNSDDEIIHILFDFALFLLGLFGILHDLGIISRVDNNAVDPLSISEEGTSQKELLAVQDKAVGVFVALALVLEDLAGAFELVEVLGRCVGENLDSEVLVLECF